MCTHLFTDIVSRRMCFVCVFTQQVVLRHTCRLNQFELKFLQLVAN
jgi:hypothetical protein